MKINQKECHNCKTINEYDVSEISLSNSTGIVGFSLYKNGWCKKCGAYIGDWVKLDNED